MSGQKINRAIIICGGICSGKTYLANLIATKKNYPVASFGGYLKSYCERNNMPIDRKTLQDIGERFVQEDPVHFAKNVINYSIGNKNTIIIEGVRHISIFEAITTIVQQSQSIFVEADLKTKYGRYINRSKSSDTFKTMKEFIEMDNHPVEHQIKLLKPMCDIVVDSTKPIEQSFYDIL